MPEIEEKQTQPFKVMWHHLSYFGFVMLYARDDGKEKAIEKLVGEIVESVKSREGGIMESIIPGYNAWYREDVLGVTDESEQEYKTKMILMFNRFFELPDDYPIEVTFGEVDEMCAQCHIGDHCKYPRMEYKGIPKWENLETGIDVEGVDHSAKAKMNMSTFKEIVYLNRYIFE